MKLHGRRSTSFPPAWVELKSAEAEKSTQLRSNELSALRRRISHQNSWISVEKANSLPNKSGVYLFGDKSKKILYVGKAKDIKKRVGSYFQKGSADSKTRALLQHVLHLSFIETTSELDAFLLEANLIKTYRPFYNIKLADDKFFPYIKIGKESIPYIAITRRVTKSEKADYFGPYPNVASLKIVLKLIRKIFPFQSVKNHAKGRCFYNHLGLCPCIPYYPDRLDEYTSTIRKIKRFLKGEKKILLKDLEKERDEASKKEEFEKAHCLQEQITMVTLITSQAFDPFAYQEEPNLRYKKNQEELESLIKTLQEYVQVASLERIECFDISNIQGTNATGSMVVFIGGEAAKGEYRRFKIRTKSTPDDFAMMKEVLSRRLIRTDWNPPNLIIIDGGKGQVSSAAEVLFSLGRSIPLIGLAKKEEIIVIPELLKRKISFSEVKLSLKNPGLNLLRKIRDEAHRFAISYHRLLRKKSFFSSERN